MWHTLHATMASVSAVLILGATARVSPSHAQTLGQPAFVSARPLNNNLIESFKPDVQVSGHVIAGVMFSERSGNLGEKTLFSAVQLPSPHEQRLCVRIMSRDGRYSSITTYVVEPTALTELPAQLLFPTKYTNDLSQFSADQITVAVSKDGCEVTSRSSVYFAASTGSWPSTVAPRNLVINVNSFGATDVFLRIGWPDQSALPVKEQKVIPCNYLAQERRTTYDYVCKFDPIAYELPKLAQLTIVRQMYGRELASIKFEISY
jgi:hypothetical protein